MLAPDAIDRARPSNMLPPLIKGYLRLGGFVGDGAVIDEQFNTIDVAIVVKTDWVTQRYYKHYTREQGADAGRRASERARRPGGPAGAPGAGAALPAGRRRRRPRSARA